MKNRRGLTTVVGGVFFLIVIVTAASYLTYSMNLFETFTENVFAVEQERENRKKESFDISRLTIENNKINLDIHNSGDIPVSFTRLWVQNVTAVDEVYRFDLNKTVATGNTAKNILSDISFTALQTETYTMKLVTDRGTTKEFSVNASTEPLNLQLFAFPQEVPTGFVTTLLLAVTNNSTQNTIYTNVQPLLFYTELGADAIQEGTSPEPHPVLEKGQTALFEWKYRITGDDGDKVKFEGSILNGDPSNVVTQFVEVQKIEVAETSETALESSIFTHPVVPENHLFFHKETIDALGERQMWSRAPEDGTEEIIDFSATNALFYTNTDENVTINVPDGNWTTYIRYMSSPMPDSLMNAGSDKETMAYHFESDLTSPLDTTTNTLMTLGFGANRPTWNSTGHQGAGAYSFSGSSFTSILVDENNDIDSSPVTTSAWFNAYSTGPASTQVIYFGSTTNGQKSYQIYLNPSGNLVFEIDTGSTIITCISPTNYKDDLWHHFVAIMPSDNDCELYVDGISIDSNFNSGSTVITLQGNIFVGARDSSGTDGFNGMIDDLIHWDDYALDETTEGEVSDLFNTNYGSSAHQMNFEIKIVDSLGNDIGFGNKTITNSFNVPMGFSSDFGQYDVPVSDVWGEFYFITDSPARVLEPGERLMMNMTFTSKVSGNLNVKMMIDDADVTSGLGSSFLETPEPDDSFPGYTTYDNGGRGTISVFNSSTKDTWLKYQSRVVFTDEISGKSYASFIDNTGTVAIGPNQDSPPIEAGTASNFEFDKPRSQPGNTSSELIPEGRYKMYVFFNGYDSAGKLFLETNPVGIVRVT